MHHIDFTKRKEPYTFIKELMEGYSDEEIRQAHENFCEFLNFLVRKTIQDMDTDKTH